MSEKENLEQFKVVTIRPEGQRREYSNYIEVSATPIDMSLKFCDIKPSRTKEEIEEIKKNGINVLVNTEIVIPIDIVQSLIATLRKQIDTMQELTRKEK